MRAEEIDWAEVRRRVEAAGRALRGEAERSPEAVREVLEARARALARRSDEGEAEAALELVVFTLAGERYGIEPAYVVEAARPERLTPLPGARPPLRAVTAWRGELLMVHDLRARLGLPPAPGEEEPGWLVVLGRGRPEMGVLADGVEEVRTVPLSEVGPPPEGAGDAVRGMTAGAVLVLEGERLLGGGEGIGERE